MGKIAGWSKVGKAEWKRDKFLATHTHLWVDGDNCVRVVEALPGDSFSRRLRDSTILSCFESVVEARKFAVGYMREHALEEGWGR